MTKLADRYSYLASIRDPKKRLEAARAWNRNEECKRLTGLTEKQFQKLPLSEKIKLVPGM